MFEEEFDGFERENDDKYYCDSIPEFQMLTKFIPLEEVGISFSGEIKIDEKTSVITNKQIKLENPGVATKTYKKVMEMRELTEVERINVSKAKLFLKKLFTVFLEIKNGEFIIQFFVLLFLLFDLCVDNYFAAFVMAAAVASNTSPVEFIKEMKKIFGSKKRKQELSDELSKMNMLGHVNSVDEDEGVRLYIKPKVSSMWKKCLNEN